MHTASWTSVDRASWKVFTFLLEPSRDRAFAQVHLQLGGPGSAGQRTVVDATVEVLVVEAAPDEWVISRLDLIEGSRVHNPSPPFRDITDAVGLHFNRSDVNGDLRQDIIDTRLSLIDSGLSVIDWDHDGFWDLLVTESMNHSLLFRNDGKGGFERELLPIEDRRLVPSQLLFVDLDGDGVEALVGNRVLYRDGYGSMGIYTRPDGEWVFLPRSRMSRIRSQIARRACGSSPVVSSSRKTSSGSLISASAMNSRCFWPPERVMNQASRFSLSPSWLRSRSPSTVLE